MFTYDIMEQVYSNPFKADEINETYKTLLITHLNELSNELVKPELYIEVKDNDYVKEIVDIDDKELANMLLQDYEDSITKHNVIAKIEYDKAMDKYNNTLASYNNTNEELNNEIKDLIISKLQYYQTIYLNNILDGLYMSVNLMTSINGLNTIKTKISKKFVNKVIKSINSLTIDLINYFKQFNLNTDFELPKHVILEFVISSFESSLAIYVNQLLNSINPMLTKTISTFTLLNNLLNNVDINPFISIDEDLLTPLGIKPMILNRSVNTVNAVDISEEAFINSLPEAIELKKLIDMYNKTFNKSVTSFQFPKLDIAKQFKKAKVGHNHITMYYKIQ